MSSRNQKEGREQIVAGLFSKKDAAALIARGARHVHSSALGQRDPGARVSFSYVESGKLGAYPWESATPIKLSITNSAERQNLIRRIAQEAPPKANRQLSEKISCVLEELITNAFFHGYVLPDGTPRFPRLKPAVLGAQEAIQIEYAPVGQGVQLTVTDAAGQLGFESISKAFERCYGAAQPQIEMKESGAGLGLYMVFEAVTHLKIETWSKKSTRVSVWIAEKKAFDPDVFSFNCFVWRLA